VGTDNADAARQAVEHLLQLGHVRIGYIGGSSHLVENPERRAGYEAALRARGIAVDPSLEIEGNGWPKGGWHGMTELMNQPAPPTAVFCYNDLTAIGAIEAASAAGLRVPEQLSVVGFDDIHLAPYVFPPLTTVAQQTDQIANLAVEMALCLADGDDPPRGSALPGKLVVRRSTAPPGRKT
jgi:DNA-binding LacI/PurR family transcriptional regulator